MSDDVKDTYKNRVAWITKYMHDMPSLEWISQEDIELMVDDAEWLADSLRDELAELITHACAEVTVPQEILEDQTGEMRDDIGEALYELIWDTMFN